MTNADRVLPPYTVPQAAAYLADQASVANALYFAFMAGQASTQQQAAASYVAGRTQGWIDGVPLVAAALATTSGGAPALPPPYVYVAPPLRSEDYPVAPFLSEPTTFLQANRRNLDNAWSVRERSKAFVDIIVRTIGASSSPHPPAARIRFRLIQNALAELEIEHSVLTRTSPNFQPVHDLWTQTTKDERALFRGTFPQHFRMPSPVTVATGSPAQTSSTRVLQQP